MGNGASSKNGKDQKKDQDLGDEDQEEDFDSYARKKAQEIGTEHSLASIEWCDPKKSFKRKIVK